MSTKTGLLFSGNPPFPLRAGGGMNDAASHFRGNRTDMSRATVKKQQPPQPENNPVLHNELIHDVEETLKREELEKFWKDYGAYVIAAIIGIIALTAALSGWRSYAHHINTAQTSTLLAAMDTDSADALAKSLGGALPSLKGGPKAMAYLGDAGALYQAGRKEEALAVYQKAASDGNLPAEWHDLSVLLAARLQWALEDGKKEGSAKALLSSLAPLAGNEKSPWHFHALLLSAQIAAHGTGDYNLAHKNLSAIQQAPDDIPPSLRERAKALDHIFSIRAASAKKE